jgi:hypothetical protein
MHGALLRSGSLQEFNVLGVEGQPVHSAALQLREGIRLKIGREAADCLAIPQKNESGDRIDWYAPFEGEVVPWSAAVSEERELAYSRLESLHAQLRSTGESMRADTQSRENQIFGRLLEKTVHFPANDHVYLVDGRPVVTFWGFTDPNDNRERAPLSGLRSAPPKFPGPVNGPSIDEKPIVGTVRKKPWWRWRWLWLLLPLFLLLALLYLMRSCYPSVQLPLHLDQIDLPGLPPPEVQRVPIDSHVGQGAATGTSGSVGANGLQGGTGSAPEHTAAEVEKSIPADTGLPVSEPEAPQITESPVRPTDSTGSQPEQQPEQTPTPATPDSVPAAPPKSDQQNGAGAAPLSIPAGAQANGSTDFLNGNWKAGAGIQDATTGRPLQLEYGFKNGAGEVRVRTSNGVQCVGKAQASMKGGNLAINNQGVATCDDGSSYTMPDVKCAPGAKTAAECTGNYGNQQFPISMKQGGK